MPLSARRAYLEAIRQRYQKAAKKQKSVILNEFCEICRYSRKYAIRILNGQISPVRRKPGPKPTYGPEVVAVLETLWEALGCVCSKKMKVSLRLWLPYYKSRSVDAGIKALLLSMSASTIDRLLMPKKKNAERRGLSTTVPAIQHKIPIKLLDGMVKHPGYIEADTVSHCGDSAAGPFVSSLTMTDLFSGWTENRAVWTKESGRILERIEEIESSLPFAMAGFACDNGTEFLNDELYRFWTERRHPVDFVRRRPYRKNDAAHVEQKNYTHVRKLLGYDRLDDPRIVPLINEIYRAYWNPLWNFFTPVMKLKSKERVGSKIKKTYDVPKTPCQRLLESTVLTKKQKQYLKDVLRTKNPFFLKTQLEKKIKQLNAIVERLERRKILDSNTEPR